MKKNTNFLTVPLALLSGLFFANCEIKNEIKPTQKSLSIADRKADLNERKKWQASPDGIKYKAWEVSPEGKKVHASYDKIKKYIKTLKLELIITMPNLILTSQKIQVLLLDLILRNIELKALSEMLG